MTFVSDRDAVIKEFQIAQDIVSSKNALSILSYVLISVENDTLTIRATDLKVSFETSIPVSVTTPGRTTVFCDKILGVLRSLPPGDIQFSLVENDRFIIKPVFKTNIDFRLKNMGAEKYPDLQWAPDNSFFQIQQKDLLDMITQTVFAVSDDETRYFMNGVFFERKEDKIQMVATDGRRLSFIAKNAQANLPEFPGVIIPPKILHLVKKLASGQGEIRIAVTEKQIFMEFDNQRLSSALIEGQFPNYNRVIPEKQEHSIQVNRNDLNEGLRRVGLMVEKSRRIYLDLSENTITLQSEESEFGTAKEDIPCRYTGPAARIALNHLYLNDPLKVVESDEVSLEFTETTKAISIHSSPRADYFHIVMPMLID